MPAKPSKSRRFAPVSAPATAPTAGAAARSAPAAEQREVTRTATAAVTERKRPAFTWRRTPAQSILMDELTIRLKRETERGRIDHSEILGALVELADENPTVFGALAGKLTE